MASLCLTGPSYLNFRGLLQQHFVVCCFSVNVVVLCSRVGCIKSYLAVFCVPLMVLEIQQNVRDACESFQTNVQTIQFRSHQSAVLIPWYSFLNLESCFSLELRCYFGVFFDKLKESKHL